MNDSRFNDRAQLRPDPATKARLVQEIAKADRPADAALQRSGGDFNSLFGLILAKPDAADAYLGPGLENYLLSLKPAPLRVLLRLTGSNVDRERGAQEIRETALHGHYLEPFAKLLLAVAALRDNDPPYTRVPCGIAQALSQQWTLYARTGPH